MENKDNKTTKIDRNQAIAQLWRMGNLSWKLRPHQKELYNLFYNSKEKTNAWLLSRRQGKTFTLLILAIEACLKKSNIVVKFVAPTKAQVNQIIRPIIREILSDCPKELHPELKTQDWVYYFPNGSEIQLAGSEAGHYQRLRGGSSWIAIVDEAQDVTDLDDVIGSVLLPTTLTTKGKIILAGTPPKNADHDFINYIEKAELNKTLIRQTIYDNKSITPEDIDLLAEELGGVNSEAFRREMLCEIIKDPTTSVIPEFTKEMRDKIVKEWVKPPFFHPYVGMDLGFNDLTVVLFAYYDFRNDKVVFEDEFVINGVELHLDKLADSILDIEFKLWTNQLTNETIKPLVRVSDIAPIVISELTRLSNYQLKWSNADKKDKDGSINFLRTMISQEKIIINPRCTTLIRHLENVRWVTKNNRDTFARSADDGHFDAVDAARYLLRAIDYKKNPYPYSVESNVFVYNTNKPQNSTHKQLDVFKKIFNRR